MSKIYRFRIIPENMKILTAADSHGNPYCALIAMNFGIGFLGLEEDLISYILTFFNIQKSFPKPPKYAFEVALFQTSIICLFQMRCPNFLDGIVFTIQKSTTSINITLYLNPGVSQFSEIVSFLGSNYNNLLIFLYCYHSNSKEIENIKII